MAVIYITFKALLAIGLWGAAATGHLLGPLNWAERAFATGSAALLIAALPITDELGFALSAAFIAWHWWRNRQTPARA
jgi:TRAP-type uncharacterized transport system fused permease subunit